MYFVLCPHASVLVFVHVLPTIIYWIIYLILTRFYFISSVIKSVVHFDYFLYS